MVPIFIWNIFLYPRVGEEHPLILKESPMVNQNQTEKEKEKEREREREREKEKQRQ